MSAQKKIENDCWLHFLGPENVSKFIDSGGSDSIAAFPHLFCNSTWAWIAQTAIELRKLGLAVSVGSDYRVGALNLGLAADIRRLPLRSDVFKVSIDADQLRPRWVNLSLVQNKKQAGRSAFWVPHWPQPGLVRRDPERSGFRTVGFFGLARNLCRSREWWQQICMEHGFEFRMKERSEWHDYSDIDVAVALRDFSCREHNEKPPTKMFNAWLAGVAFIGGCDSAYTQVGRPGKNFLRCRTDDDLVRSLEHLRARPDRAEDLVCQGLEAVSQVGSRDATAQHWVRLIDEVVAPRFLEWRKSSHRMRKASVAAGYFSDWTIRQRNQAWRLTKRVTLRR